MGNLNLSVAAVAATAGLAVSASVACADVIDWAAPVDGNWALPFNWSPANVPDSAGEQASLAFNAPYTVTLNANATVGGVVIPNSLATLSVMPGAYLVPVADVVNDGTIRVNPGGSNTNAHIRFDASAAIAGTGTLVLFAAFEPGDAQIISNGATVTQGANHTIRGSGDITAPLVNNGTVVCDNGGLLRLSGGNKVNNGVLAASDQGILTLDGITVTQGSEGAILALNHLGNVRFISMTLVGGSMDSDLYGEHWVEKTVTFDAVTNLGYLLVRRNAVLIVKNGLTNDGDIIVDSDYWERGLLRFDTDGTLGGSGAVYLPGYSEVATSGATLTNGPDHMFYGRGIISATLINNGRILADNQEVPLLLTGGPKTNNDRFEAYGSSLAIENCTVTQGPDGLMLGRIGGKVRYKDMTLIGGEVFSENYSAIHTINGAVTFDGVLNTGNIEVGPGAALVIVNGLMNEGVVTVNPKKNATDAAVRFDSDGTLGGAGEIILRANPNDPGDAQLNTSNATITHGPDHLIHGAGSIAASLANEGTILADSPGGTLVLHAGLKTNNGLIAATGGGTLAIDGLTVTQNQDGLLLAQDAGTIAFSSTTIAGGEVRTEAAGRATADGVTSLDVVTNGGSIDVNPGALVIVTGALTNDGVITVNPVNAPDDARLRVDSADIAGVGEIILRAGDDPADAQIGGHGVVLTIGPGQTLRGRGLLTGPILNHGTLAPGESIGSLQSNDSLNLGDSSVYEAQVVGADAGQADTIQVTGAATLAGNLAISLIDGFVPETCAPITVLTAGAVAGAFESVIGDPGNGRAWVAVYSSDRVDIVAMCYADMNADCALDLFDFLGFVNLFNSGDAIADCTGDQTLDLFDFLCFVNAFNKGC